VQTTVNIARKEGIAPTVLRSIVDRRPEALPEELADVFHFVDKVLRRTGDEEGLREKIRARYGRHGDAALSEIALVLSSARAFPVTKRVLGYATSCENVKIDVGVTCTDVRARGLLQYPPCASGPSPFRCWSSPD
jgi:hypothetical protein